MRHVGARTYLCGSPCASRSCDGAAIALPVRADSLPLDLSRLNSPDVDAYVLDPSLSCVSLRAAAAKKPIFVGP